MAENDSSWEEHSITEKVIGDSSSNSGSNSASNSSDFSFPDEDQDEEICGAEPYRFEPLAPAGEAELEDDEAKQENDRLLNTDWFVVAVFYQDKGFIIQPGWYLVKVVQKLTYTNWVPRYLAPMHKTNVHELGSACT